MRNVSDRSCTESHKMHFTFNNIFLKIMTFMRDCGKVLQSQTGHR